MKSSGLLQNSLGSFPLPPPMFPGVQQMRPLAPHPSMFGQPAGLSHIYFLFNSVLLMQMLFTFTLDLMFCLHRWSSDAATRLQTSSLGDAVSPPEPAVLWRNFPWRTGHCAISSQWIPQPVCSPTGENFVIMLSKI